MLNELFLRISVKNVGLRWSAFSFLMMGFAGNVLGRKIPMNFKERKENGNK